MLSPSPPPELSPAVAGLWQWPILGPILRKAFTPIPAVPVPEWASKNVFLSRKITSKPGYYDPDEFGWTWEWQDLVRTRAVWTQRQADGAIILVPEGTPGATRLPVTRVTSMKSSVSGFTEGVLNAIRWIAKFDPQNVIYSIDSAKSAADINENRLQPTLQALGEEIFTGEEDDVKRFLLTLKRMLVYFLGSFSEAAFSYKFAEVCVGDEVEEHGDENSIENLESRLKSALRPLLYLLSKPKLEGGRIALEHAKGTQFVYEIPCPHCGHYQQLLQDNMKFDHCKDILGEWDFAAFQTTYFQCLNSQCKKPIEESWKRWFNDRRRRRWRQTNLNPEPGHVSFHMSDFYGYHPDAQWPKLGVKYVQSKGDPVARQAYRNHHEGLPWEVRATKTEEEDILAMRGEYKRGQIPWKPYLVILMADVGLTYVKWSVNAFRGDGEMAAIDWGEDLHPDDLLKVIASKRYPCLENGKTYTIQIGFCDAKYRKEEVHGSCRKSPGRKLWPMAGISADLTVRSISLNKVPGMPDWFGVIVFVDRDAKSELYEHRITEWVEWESRGKHLPADDPKRRPPDYPRIWFPADLRKDDTFLQEHTKERLVEITSKDKGWLPHAAKQFVWKRKGANHWGDCSKGAIVGYRYLTRQSQGTPD